MASLLLAVIYLAFISLGLPDALLGSAWPAMHADLGAPVSAMGVITMIISAGTICSSLASNFLTRKLGTGVVTLVSVLLTAGAMLAFSFAKAFWVMCILSVPYGLGAGGVDAALNNYVALHYKPRHMSWLHCFWGVGAIVGPFIMGACLTGGGGWDRGYAIVSYIQFGLCIALLCSLSLWVKPKGADELKKPLSLPGALRLKGVWFILIAFLCYSGVESTASYWASSYFSTHKGVEPELAATLGSLFYIGITAGRFVCGFVAEKAGDRRLILVGIVGMAAGIALIALPVGGYGVTIAGFLVMGIGCAPVYPSIIHSTPNNFGAENSQAVIGVEMAFAYVGTTCLPPLFGLVAQYLDIAFLPLYLGVFALLLLCMTELLNRSKRALK